MNLRKVWDRSPSDTASYNRETYSSKVKNIN